MGCGGAEEEAVGKLLRPLKNNNRLRHLSIIASNRSSTPRTSARLSLFGRFLQAHSSPQVRCELGPLQLELLLRVRVVQVLLGLLARTVDPSRLGLPQCVQIGVPDNALEQPQPCETSQDFVCARTGAPWL